MKKLKKILEKHSDVLTSYERDVVRLIFGLDDGRRRRFEEVSQLFGTTSSQIKKKLLSAIEKMPEFLQAYEERNEAEWQKPFAVIDKKGKIKYINSITWCDYNKLTKGK